MNRFAAAFVVMLAAVPALSRADDQPAPPAPELPARVETRHSITLDNARIDYRAIAETLPLTEPKGPGASVYTVTYIADTNAAGKRPVAFVFNGGPGAASVFLHLGALGPRIMATPGNGAPPAPPVKLVDNPSSWLGFTDLVFVDPVGTGFSRVKPAKGGEAGKPDEPSEKAYWNVRGDLDSLAMVVRLWLSRNNRWGSPVYLVGESYGGFRAAALSETLAKNVGVRVSGLVLVSPALNIALLHPGIADLLAAAFRLPSYAATAAYFAGTPMVQVDVDAAETFAFGQYLTGLAAMKGIPPKGDPFIARIAALTGLTEDLIRRQRGRVPPATFAHELRRNQGELLSIYDATVARATRGNPWDDSAGDPVLDPAIADYTAAFNIYAPEYLGYHTDLPYKVLPREVGRRWDWDGAREGTGGLGLALSSLEAALLAHPQTRVLIAHGRTDLVTPYLASRWLIDQLSVPSAVREGIRLKVYAGGHMMYMRPESRKALAEDAKELFSLPSAP
jgi:carboxypeptidase C (cathepsin A)